MSIVERIVDQLRSRHPHVAYRVSGQEISVEAQSPDGFAVTVSEAAGEWVVSFDGWHDHFAPEDEAFNCFGFGLSDQCRLKISYRGDYAYRWTVQVRSGEQWVNERTSCLLFVPFWRKHRVEYRQNTIIHTPVLFESFGERKV